MRLTAPIALFVFNRPSQTRKVFAAIEEARPRHLYIIGDGPRAEQVGDADRCSEVRSIVQDVSWPCEVRTNLSDRNLGLRERTVSGTDWVFEHEEKAIFLQDDTLPSQSFFLFCQEVLDKYHNDRRIAAVCGSKLAPSRWAEYSYFFSSIFNSWGHALWRRSWECRADFMRQWPKVRDQHLLANVFTHPNHYSYWNAIMESTYRGRYDSWGYPFTLDCWVQNGLTIVPSCNLVRNIGFGADSTHTRADPGYGGLQLQQMELPLRHPPFVMADKEYDDCICDDLVRQASLPWKIRNKLHQIINDMARQRGRRRAYE